MTTMNPSTRSIHLLDHVRPTEVPFGETQDHEAHLSFHPTLVTRLRTQYLAWREARRRDLAVRGTQGPLRGVDEMR